MTISEKVAYVKGLFEGMGLDSEDSKQAKLFRSIIEVLEEVGLSIEDMEDELELLNSGIDAVSDDLADVEELLFGEDEDLDEDEEDDDFFEVECPNCQHALVIDNDVLEAGSIQCPNCQEVFSIDLADEEEEDEEE
ncbi:MAG: zinc-ribbon domain-containing protein [Oscillospiraceae bacterium]|nr:zinc-ribbon domain-containing protein [Oscillospiraceae bacterium]